jgi:hypothetical protein
MALKDLLARTTLLDKAIVLALFAAALGGAAWATTAPGGERLIAESGGKVVFTAPLGTDRTFSLHGPLGETAVALRGGKARILDSPCAHKVCMGMGEVGRSGQILACVPNRLLLRIEGGKAEETEYDLLTR